MARPLHIEPPMSIRLYTAGGDHLGFGHLVRARALAEELQKRGLQVEFATDAEPADVVIRDLPVHLAAPRGRKLTIDILDEAHEASEDCDLYFSSFVETDGRFEHAVIRRGITFLRALVDDMYVVRSVFRLVPVMLGGVDPSGISMAVGDALGSLPRGLSPHVVTGAGSAWGPTGGSIEDALTRAVVAVTSGGMTLLEAACVGVPVVTVSHNRREHERLERLAVMGLPWFQYAGRTEDVATLGRVREMACSAVDDVDDDTWPSRAATHSVDGKGLDRVASSIVEAVASLGTRGGFVSKEGEGGYMRGKSVV